MDRLEFLKRLGVLTVGASFIGVDVEAATAEAAADDAVAAKDVVKLDFPIKPLETDVDKPVTVVIIGAGNRGRTYAKYAERFPDALRVVGCADLNPARREAMRKKFDIPSENCFSHFNEVFARNHIYARQPPFRTLYEGFGRRLRRDAREACGSDRKGVQADSGAGA